MGPRKAKQEVKFKKPTFYSILYTGYKLHKLVAPPPENAACQGPSTPHRALRNCDRMHEHAQILALFQLKCSKRAIFTKKCNKGRKKRAFPKRAKKGQKGRKKGEHLWERARRDCSLSPAYVQTTVCEVHTFRLKR